MRFKYPSILLGTFFCSNSQSSFPTNTSSEPDIKKLSIEDTPTLDIETLIQKEESTFKKDNFLFSKKEDFLKPPRSIHVQHFRAYKQSQIRRHS
jgi:hypothetical protein